MKIEKDISLVTQFLKENCSKYKYFTVTLFFLACCLCLVFPLNICTAQELGPDGEPLLPLTGLPDIPAPPKDVNASDKPLDTGHTIIIDWKKSPDDGNGRNIVTGYNIYRSETVSGEFSKLNGYVLNKGDGSYQDKHDPKIGGHKVERGKTYYYKVSAVTAQGSESFSPVVNAAARPSYYNRKHLVVLAVIVYVTILVVMIELARGGRELYIRRLAGIDALDEAVGRATEMGKPVLYLCGMSDLSEVSTIAAINILSGVAKKVGQYQSKLLMPCRDPMVMTVTQEVVKEAYLSIGRPEAFREDDIFYTTYDQFPYVASVDGIMLREKPATNIYMGYYYAESLILAETGSMSGAIQIAGTDAITQLPFFVVACDYTIIGEELYAASAYISRDPKLVGSIKGQDYMKFVLMVWLAVGIIFVTLLKINPQWQTLESILKFFQAI